MDSDFETHMANLDDETQVVNLDVEFEEMDAFNETQLFNDYDAEEELKSRNLLQPCSINESFWPCTALNRASKLSKSPSCLSFSSEHDIEHRRILFGESHSDDLEKVNESTDSLETRVLDGVGDPSRMRHAGYSVSFVSSTSSKVSHDYRKLKNTMFGALLQVSLSFLPAGVAGRRRKTKMRARRERGGRGRLGGFVDDNLHLNNQGRDRMVGARGAMSGAQVDQFARRLNG
ncbi:hypothetical protein E3N88_15552 [Mikania micrantha]|uniref:Uncharacterized protein n=1 Tax=Mikania micrantha TaxID=192012 RepID=A0A5N6NWB5_9ASTR|nr:hypothetical protein E3N88_15552 [Mikania micrantha]